MKEHALALSIVYTAAEMIGCGGTQSQTLNNPAHPQDNPALVAELRETKFPVPQPTPESQGITADSTSNDVIQQQAESASKFEACVNGLTAAQQKVIIENCGGNGILGLCATQKRQLMQKHQESNLCRDAISEKKDVDRQHAAEMGCVATIVRDHKAGDRAALDAFGSCMQQQRRCAADAIEKICPMPDGYDEDAVLQHTDAMPTTM